MKSYKDEIDNLAHTLNDIKTSVHCSKELIKGHTELVKRLEPRIESLKTRIDWLTIKTGEIKDGN